MNVNKNLCRFDNKKNDRNNYDKKKRKYYEKNIRTTDKILESYNDDFCRFDFNSKALNKGDSK